MSEEFKERRSYDSTARQMASDANNKAQEASKDIAVLTARLTDHLASCNLSNEKVEKTLTSLRNLLWGLLIVVLGSCLAVIFKM